MIPIRAHLFQYPTNPRFQILETSVQMLDKSIVNNNLYRVFQRNFAKSVMCNWVAPVLHSGLRIHTSDIGYEGTVRVLATI